MKRDEYPDRLIQFKPKNTGSPGRKREPPAGNFAADGCLSINHEAADLLGNPDRVLVSINPRQARIYLRPTTPDSAAGWAMNGGGNIQHRIRLKEVINQYPLLVGRYRVSKAADGIALSLVEE